MTFRLTRPYNEDAMNTIVDIYNNDKIKYIKINRWTELIKNKQIEEQLEATIYYFYTDRFRLYIGNENYPNNNIISINVDVQYSLSDYNP